MATNRPDTLDPALLRPGRLDRKVEFGLPDLESRTQIFQIHTRAMACERDVRFELLARLCPNSTGADIRSVCTEAVSRGWAWGPGWFGCGWEVVRWLLGAEKWLCQWGSTKGAPQWDASGSLMPGHLMRCALIYTCTVICCWAHLHRDFKQQQQMPNSFLAQLYGLVLCVCTSIESVAPNPCPCMQGMFAIRARRKTVTEKDFLDAVNKVIKGYQKFSATPKYMVYN